MCVRAKRCMHHQRAKVMASCYYTTQYASVSLISSWNSYVTPPPVKRKFWFHYSFLTLPRSSFACLKLIQYWGERKVEGLFLPWEVQNQNCNSQSVVYGAFKFCGFLNVLDILSLNSTRKEKILVSIQFSTQLRSSLACLKSIKYWGEQSNLLQFEGRIKTAILKV